MLGGSGSIEREPPTGRATSPLSKDDLYLFNQGTHRGLAKLLGAHLSASGGASFAVWAPNASAVAVIADFNNWDPKADPLNSCGDSGIWQAQLNSAKCGDVYKFAIIDARG